MGEGKKRKGEAKKEKKVKKEKQEKKGKEGRPRRGAEQCVHFVTNCEVGRTLTFHLLMHHNSSGPWVCWLPFDLPSTDWPESRA